ncbi:capsule assembly Wzi family protein [Pedobacter aquatilis]|uniref:capsule assembly Wzi family protein n=1 Tax=Pedobacter aquatilis TaxID=351343 RepID=UPI0025B58B1A|nr:capsule assembly Wzi family protein [Pedobacter aquatilis]MDN3587272.1 capsule assembly Wzi family protein [Pedobacter aquatilis]
MKIVFNYIFIFFLIGISDGLFAQSIPVGMQGLEDYYRRLQLQGKLDSTISFSNRPVSNEALRQTDVFDPLNALTSNGTYKPLGAISFANGKGVLQILPFSWQQQINSHHPYGWNDGAMIPAKGYQTMLSGGFFVKYGPLSIQFRPEYVYAQNSSFESYGNDRSISELQAYLTQNYNLIDNPERFGNGAYSKLNWGQSSIRLTVGPASLGLSNENLWWGPGIKNSLMMSNHAQGFKHVTLNTVRPVKTAIGSFEGQIFGGRLEQSGFAPLDEKILSNSSLIYTAPRNDWRYLAGLNINYQPKWLPGLFVGFTRTFMSYGPDLEGLDDYIPFFIPFQKNRIDNGGGDDGQARDQRTSLYARWVMTKAKAEVYFEYGLNDNAYNFRDFIGSPDHSRAYLFGLRKLIPLKNHNDEYIQVGAEVTQMSQTIDGLLLRNAFGFYYHGEVKQGYTNNGEVLGAGTGSGGNLQSFDISWVKGLKRLGLTFDRLEHNRDFYDFAGFGNAKGGSRSWVDFALAAEGNWDYKNFLFNAKIQGIKSLNYQWRQKDFSDNQYYIPHNTVFNFHGELGVAFRF